MKSRIPELMDDTTLQAYRWKTPLPIPTNISLADQAQPIEMHIGTCNHVFANATDSLPAITQEVWGYGLSEAISSPGPTLIAQADQTTRVTWVNDFDWNSGEHFPFVEAPPDLRAGGMMRGRYSNSHHVVHLHGAHVPWESDGHPVRDPQFKKQPVIRPRGFKTCTYPNTQPGGAMLWYHDHTMDATSRNVYAGLAGGYLLRHPKEHHLDNLFGGTNPPVQLLPPREIPLVIQDRSFLQVASDQGKEAKWLFYGDATNSNIRPSNGPRFTVDGPSPEFKGTAMCVNGVITPTLPVNQAPYRFRVLNGCNSRMLVLKVERAMDSPPEPGIPAAWQIGTDGGLFAAPVDLPAGNLILAPGERADLIIDFSHTIEHDCFQLVNCANSGSTGSGNKGDAGLPDVIQFKVSNNNTDANQNFLHNLRDALININPETPIVVHPNSNDLIQQPDRCYLLEEISPINLPQQDGIRAFPDRSWTAVIFENIPINQTATGHPSRRTRQLWGGEAPDQDATGGIPTGGPNIEDIDKLSTSLINGNNAPIKIGATQVWDIYNFSPDTHPIHLHQAQFEIIGRRDSDQSTFFAPDLNERGWKDTIRANRHSRKSDPLFGGVTRIRVKFSGGSNGDKEFSYDGQYVMHCHILEHEDMGMMRPLVIHP